MEFKNVLVPWAFWYGLMQHLWPISFSNCPNYSWEETILFYNVWPRWGKWVFFCFYEVFFQSVFRFHMSKTRCILFICPFFVGVKKPATAGSRRFPWNWLPGFLYGFAVVRFTWCFYVSQETSFISSLFIKASWLSRNWPKFLRFTAVQVVSKVSPSQKELKNSFVVL